jgi:hypothetical protein
MRHHKLTCIIKKIPSKEFTRTQLRVTDIHDSDDTLQRVASIAERTTPTILLEVDIDVDDDHNLDDESGG